MAMCGMIAKTKMMTGIENEVDTMMKDITGQRFGRLVAIKPIEERYKDGSVLWLCKCDCGKETVVNGAFLRKGFTKSCGCLFDEVVGKNLQQARNARRKHFGCLYCGSDKHYAGGLCRSCYDKKRRGTLE